ncbi:hypothetical protein ABIC03_002208 [Bradyrhizobium sp. RT6a]|uniref:hypothetical protein n=1 Tax=Bradyrhizobium sp. RT6a TaxID=3156381 RepID=UPI003396FC6A
MTIGSDLASGAARMQQHQQNIDELARMERICLNLAAGATMPEERAGLLEMAGNYAAAGPKLGPKAESKERTRRRDGSGAGQAPLFSLRKITRRHLIVRCSPNSNTVGAGSSPATPASETKYLV